MKFFIIIKQHSERVPNKNFKSLGGIPLWKHLITTLKGQQVYIDTDSEEIFEESKKLDWVTCYKRDRRFIELENSTDFKVSPVLMMIENFLDTYVEDENETIVTPHVTSPFIRLETIIDAAKYIGQYESVQACTAHKEFAYYQNKPVNFDPKVVQKTQDLEPILMGNGAFFIFTKAVFKMHKNRVGKNNFFFPLNFKEAVEIDTQEDFDLAKIIYENN